MKHSKVIFLAALVLVMSAGVVVGRLWSQLPGRPHGPGNPSWLADQLNLTPEQRQQMDAVWADTKQKIDKTVERRRLLDRERDQAIEDLLGPEQWAAYGKLIDEFRAHRADLDKERAAILHQANESSQALLTDDQKQKWDSLRQSRPHDRGHWPHGDGAQRSTTMPIVPD